MVNILIKSGWLGRNTADWFANPEGFGQHVLELEQELLKDGFTVQFSGSAGAGFVPDVEIHFERQLAARKASRKILVYSEPDFIQPQNRYFSERKYDLVFDPRTDQKFDSRRAYCVFPRNMTDVPARGFHNRDTLISCIASNKNAVLRSKYNLYGRRAELIDKLTDALGEDFELYGSGWESIYHPTGIVSKAAFRSDFLRPFLKRRASLASYRGTCPSKKLVMERSLFTLCIENSAAPGSLTEKLFDCLQFGSIPLYLGASDIEEIFPANLIVDLRKVHDIENLVETLKTTKESDYIEWLENVEKHYSTLRHDRSTAVFVQKIVAVVKQLLAT